MSISRDAKSGSPRRLLMETQDNTTDLIIYLNIMHNNSTTRFAALLVATIFACLPSLAGWVYYDNVDRGKTNEQYASQQGDSGNYTIYFQNDKNWSNVGVWVWDEAHSNENYTGGTWPGKIISTDQAHPDLYVYTFTCTDSNTKLLCIFNDGKSSGATETEKYEVTNGWVYNSSGKQKHIDDWVSPDPGKLIDYTIYFDNLTSWNDVNVKIMGNVAGQSTGGKMFSNLNSSINEITFQAPENASLTCYFYCSSDENGTKTDTFKLINRHIYTNSGDKGLREDYVPSNLPEAEWWYEPENPTQNDKITLYFNRAYKSDSKLKNTDDIYLWTGAVLNDGSDTWYGGAPSDNWNYSNYGNADHYKMTRSNRYPDSEDIYEYSYSPTLAGWAGLDVDARATKIGIIFRDKSGSIKQHGENNQYINLRQLPTPGAGLGKYQSCVITDNDATGLSTVEITGERGTLLITPMAEDVLKIFTRKNGQTAQERASISVVDPADEAYCLTKPQSVTVTGTNDDTAEVLSLFVDGKKKLEVNKEDCIITFLKENEEVALKELNGLVNTIGRIEVSFEGMNDAGFYGGGYNGNTVNQDGKTLTMNNTQTGGWAQNYKDAPHNICIPFYASTEGYGVYFDDHYRKAQIFPSKNGTTYSSGSKNPIAYYYIGGGTMQKVMENYTKLTGVPELPAYWSLGYITSKYSFRSRSAAEEVISKTRNESKIPLDGIVFDIHWQGGPKMMGKIDWDTSNYNNPTEMMDNFRKDYNVHSIAITEPYFTGSCGNFKTEYFADNSVSGMEWLQNGSNVGLLDITNTDACTWFKGLYKKRTKEGVDSWWLDLGEPEMHDGDSHYTDDSSVDQIHNEYGQRWLKTAFDAMKEYDRESGTETRRILMPRAGTAGMQRYNACPWTGDIKRSWSGLAAQVPALVSAAMSGVSTLGSDIGGFSEIDHNNYNDKTYLRWVQLGVFYPMMRTHAQEALNPEPYKYPGVLDNVREAINLRYAYLPYTYSQSYQYTAFGTPIARPANFDDSDKSRLANSIDTYYWGPDLYVAPMLSEGTSRSISLPEGEWLDANDFKTVYDSKIDNYPVPYNKLARFMREGSFLTRYRESSFTSTADIQTDKITVDYFLNYQDYSGNNLHKDSSAGSKWYDDDHTTVNPLKDNSYLLTHFHGHGVVNGTNHAVVLYIDREGDGWDGMYSRADGENRWTRSEDSNFEGEQYDGQDILLAIHKIKCDGGLANNIEINLHDYGPRPAAASEAENSIDAAPAAGDVDPKEIWPKRYAMKAITEDAIKNAQTFENGKIKDKDSEGFWLDKPNETLYVRMPKLDPRRNYALLIGNKGEIVNVGEVNLAAMTLEYADGCFTYSAPEGTESLTLGVYSTTGASMGLYEGLTADGVADQVSVSLPQGVYIGRLTGRDASGASVVKTVKVMVK